MIREALHTNFDPPLDAGIERAVIILREHGVETFESCQGGDGHAYPRPAIRFTGERPEGFRALAVALQHGLHVAYLRRVWRMEDGDPAGPWWELEFDPPRASELSTDLDD